MGELTSAQKQQPRALELVVMLLQRDPANFETFKMDRKGGMRIHGRSSKLQVGPFCSSASLWDSNSSSAFTAWVKAAAWSCAAAGGLLSFASQMQMESWWTEEDKRGKQAPLILHLQKGTNKAAPRHVTPRVFLAALPTPTTSV